MSTNDVYPTLQFQSRSLEAFFGAIRSSGGFNNNPTAKQFKAAYKIVTEKQQPRLQWKLYQTT